MRNALGWIPDPLIDSSECNCSSSLLVLLKANGFAAASLAKILQVFSRLVIKDKQEYAGLDNRQRKPTRPEASRAS
jgi:hypothetical protein